MLKEGTIAPVLKARNQDGQEVELSDLRGTWVVLWWYPKASTPGCTLEGIHYQRRFGDFVEVGAHVIGISFDDPDDNCSFRDDHDFDFSLWSDHSHQAGEAFEVEREETDRYYGMSQRITYLVDPLGVIRRSYLVGPDDIKDHPSQVLADLRELSG
jgi:peroxiredoxin Q/BCP